MPYRRVFDISTYNLKSFFDDHDWVYDGNECILRREIWSTGKSRAFVNDSPVYLNDLKEIGEKLIDIHSQHQNLALNDNLFQLNVVDTLARTGKELREYVDAYKDYRSSEKELNDMRLQAQKTEKRRIISGSSTRVYQKFHLNPVNRKNLKKSLKH